MEGGREGGEGGREGGREGGEGGREGGRRGREGGREEREGGRERGEGGMSILPTSERTSWGSFIPLRDPSFLPETMVQWNLTPGGLGHELANSVTSFSGRTMSVSPAIAMVRSARKYT